MNQVDVEQEMARLDTVYRPVATTPVDSAQVAAVTDLGAAIASQLAGLGVDGQAEAVLRAVVESYSDGDDAARAEIRRAFDRYPSFRWAAHLPVDPDTAADYRAHLIHLSARDQGDDPRDEILTLQALCERARHDGIDLNPVLTEVAALSSDVDRYGMGSMRSIILRNGTRRTG